MVYLGEGEAASDLHVVCFHSLNALPMYIHYTPDSLSVARLSLAYWQNTYDMCYQVEFDNNYNLFPKWPAIKTADNREALTE